MADIINLHKKRGRPRKQKEPEKVDTVEQAIVKTQRNKPGPKNFMQEHVDPGDNARYLRYAMVSLSLPPIDISDEKQVQQRVEEYFMHCIENDRKPNIVGMANWLGVDRTTLASWKRGEYRSDTHSHLIQKYCQLLEEQWYDYMMNGKVNPASGIFLGKNVFAYSDTQNIVVTPNNPMGEEQSAEDIQKRIEGSIVIDVDDVEGDST